MSDNIEKIQDKIHMEEEQEIDDGKDVEPMDQDDRL